MISNRTKCQFGIVVTHCQGAGNAALTEAGLQPLSCGTCTSGVAPITGTVKKALALYGKLSSEQQPVIQKWLRAIGMVPEADSLLKQYNKPVVEVDFVCPVTAVDLVSPCKLKKCRYHINYPWALNCLLAYTQQQGIEQLSEEEISYLYNLSPAKVYESTRNSLYTLRTNAIVIAREQAPELKPKFSYFKTMEVCCVCESAIDEHVPAALQIPSISLAYCSKECKAEKPPRLIELEEEYGLEIGVILNWAFKKFQSLSISEQALGLPRWLSHQACTTFLGAKLEDYFVSLKSIQKHRKTMLMRRTWHKASWVDQMVSKLKRVEKAVQKEHGKPSIDMRPVYSSLKYVLDSL